MANEIRQFFRDFLSSLTDTKSLSLKKYFHSKSASEITSIKSLIIFLELFNAISQRKHKDDTLVKAVSTQSLYFLNSLSLFIGHNLPLISNWTTPINSPDSLPEDILTSGSYLLQSMEKRRSQELNFTIPLAKSDIILFIIKARISGHPQPQFLSQFNLKTMSFQLIGGVIKDHENISVAINRLVRKELPLNNLSPKDYRAAPTDRNFSYNGLAKKTNVYTQYTFSFYSLTFSKSIIKLTPDDRWLSLEELINEKTLDNIPVMSPLRPISNKVDKKEMLNILNGLPLSLTDTQISDHTSKPASSTQTTSSPLSLLLQKDESESLEFKSSIRWDFATSSVNKALEKTIIRSIASFLNSHQGILLIGVNDNQEILGLNYDIQTLKKKNLDGYMQHLTSLISTYLSIEIAPFIKISFEKNDSEFVCIVNVEPSPLPVFLKDGDNRHFYIRSGNTTRELNPEEAYKYIGLHW